MNSATAADPGRHPLSPTRAGLTALLAFPGLLTVYLAFNSGGMFEVTTAFAAVVVLVVAAVAVAVAPRPLAGLSRLGILACGLLSLFALWTLLSAQWSDAPARALVSFDRALLYLAVLALFSCVPRSEQRFRWLLRGLLGATATVALIGLLSRLQPDLWPTATGLVGDRLSYPITYWNTFALLVGMACILAVHHTADEHEPMALRVGAAALLPPLGATLLLTFSRGAIAATVLGIVVYLLIARPRGMPGAFLAVAAPAAIALGQTYEAELVHAGLPLTPAAISQADHLTLVLVLCMVGAAARRTLTLALDNLVVRLPLESPRWRHGGQIAATAVAGLALIAFLAAGGPTAVREQYDKFVDNTHESSSAEAGQRSRLLEVGNDGRRPLWEVARDTYRQDQLQGSGAGTFQTEWERNRAEGPERLYAYSLYLETLAELGLVGIALLAGCLLAILVGIARSARGSGRPAYAAGFAVALAWTLHAGVDIDWQTPALGVPVFALAGLALARSQVRLKYDRGRSRVSSSTRAPAKAAAWTWRPALALACVGLAVVPAGMALARSHLQDSVEALTAGDCARAHDEAQKATSTFDVGARPYEVLAMCAARHGDGAASIEWGRAAVAHDPASWEPHYALALAQGAAGVAPQRQIRQAVAANPGVRSLREAAAAFRGGGPAQWRVTARTLPFALE
jgi:hypothetical protein